MAKNITLLGASYSDVPAVELPQTGGGVAEFTDTSDADATAGDIAQGKTAYVNGVKLVGTASGGGAAVVVTEYADTGGGVVKEITAVDISDTTLNSNAQMLSGVKAHGADGTLYTGSIASKSSSDLTASGATVTAPAGYYESSATKTVASGTEGTPTASKGTVSNHAVTVTPSVTNSAGYISGGTKTGTGVSVSASELVSGTYSVTSSGTKDVTNYASASVPAGTEGTPTATKGTVSNHSVSVTPSVTNSGGYITGSTKTGTAVTVSASELVSGSETKTANGTYDVTNLATLVVNVGSTGKNIQVNSNAYSRQANSYGATNLTLTVAKTGTYKVSWTAWRSSSQGTMGTNLYRNSTSGTAQQTFANTYGQHIVLENQSYTQGDVLTLYATSGSNSRLIWVSNLIIEEQ